jgi:hypothetical protein
MTSSRKTALILVLATVAAPVLAAPDCAPPTSLPPVYQGWQTPKPAPVATDDTTATALALGQAITVKLAPATNLRFPAHGPKTPDSTVFGSVFGYTASVVGTLRIAASGAAWIDLVSGAETLKPRAFGHGPDCTGIHKYVDFDVAPGHYLIRVSAPSPDLVLLLGTP